MTREEAIKIIDCYDIGFYDLSGAKIPADKLADAFDMAIEALGQKKRHGKWEQTEVEGGKIYVCSECREGIYKSTFEENVHYYCSNCGAKMDKE